MKTESDNLKNTQTSSSFRLRHPSLFVLILTGLGISGFFQLGSMYMLKGTAERISRFENVDPMALNIALESLNILGLIFLGGFLFSLVFWITLAIFIERKLPQ